ncbi:hypothetical protein CK203_039171 [Vitis vinifera]|uniref:Uncharacterized protein n=1 Tax=Vitis vinifera TaxID=29760 RepID=A0A438H7C4_VITVI|nr:hypothetical protein CK203_039171 [Vitis vinifera]
MKDRLLLAVALNVARLAVALKGVGVGNKLSQAYSNFQKKESISLRFGIERGFWLCSKGPRSRSQEKEVRKEEEETLVRNILVTDVALELKNDQRD